MDLLHATFKEMEQEFNAALEHFNVEDSTERNVIKLHIFYHLKEKFPDLKLEEVDCDYNKFRMEVPYKNPFKGIEEYDSGYVKLVFSIRTKKTDQLKKVSARQKKYVNTKHESPIKFSHYAISSFVASFSWKTEDPDDLRIEHSGYSSGDERTEEIKKKKSVADILSVLLVHYEDMYRHAIFQPIIHQILFKGEKFQTLHDRLPSDIQDVIDKKTERRNISKELIDFAIDNHLIVI